ncbi:hypothetical protein BASA60_006815 [Batrachochytrium salamandrivorans]|nr:hypothetical protein BASA60_006815 [Batrachochytrium salamandrivorans]
MFSCLKTWSEYALKVFEPCGISSLSEEHMSTATVTKMAPMVTPIVTESSTHQAPQPSADLPNDLDMIS